MQTASVQQITISNFRIKGVRYISSSDWDGEIYQTSRAAFLEHKEDKLFGRPGVYVIYADHFDKQTYGHHIYIGQGDEVRTRLACHAAKKYFWNRVLFFTSEWMNVAYTFNIENEFLSSAKLASRYVLDNDVGGQSKQMGTEDLARCAQFIAGAKDAVQLLNIDIFTANEDGIFHAARSFMPKASLRIINWDPPAVLMHASSTLRLLMPPTQAVALLAEGKVSVDPSGRNYVFNEDVELEVETESIANVFGVSISFFENSCGVTVSDRLEAVRDARIQELDH